MPIWQILFLDVSNTRTYVVLHEYVWLHPTGNTQAEYVLIGLTSIRIEMKSSDILSVGLTAAWKRTNFRPCVSIQSPADIGNTADCLHGNIAMINTRPHISQLQSQVNLGPARARKR